MGEAVAVSLPKDVLTILGRSPEKELKKLAALELYREGRLTLRQAAHILGVSYRRMMEILAEHRIYLNYGEEELKEDMEYALSRKRL